MLKLGLNNLWPTQVYLGNIENKQALDNACQSIFVHENLFATTSGHFQDLDVLRDGSAEMQIFRDEIVWPAFSNYLNELGIDILQYPDRHLKSWLTGSKQGYMIPAHNHSGASVSAVFYLLCDEDRAGELILMDPRTNANRGYKDEFKSLFENKIYSPKSAEYIMFPSYLYHHTVPFLGKLRLAIPVDLFL
jgi:hypothetical protein